MRQFRQHTPLLVALLLMHLLLVAALLLPLPVASPAAAAAPPAENLPVQLAIQADLIVRGRVLEVTAGWNANRRWIESTVSVAVNYTVAGVSPATLTLYSEGGYLPAEGLGMRSSHAASFVPHEEVLLFLRNESGRLTLVAEEAGKFSVAFGVAAHGASQSQMPLTALYAQIAERWQGQEDLLTLPADRASREPTGSGVVAAAPSDFVFENLRWPGTDPQVHFVVNPFAPQSGGPDGSDADFLAALTNPARTWSVPPGAALGLIYDGPTPATDVAYNGQNEVIFFAYGQNSVAGRSRIWFDQNRTILEADFWLNADLNWDATGQPASNEMDAESVALHEFGHWLGLGHDTDPSAAMYASLQAGTLRRTLHPSDLAGITYIYPCPAAACVPDIYADGTPTPTNTLSPTPSPTTSPTRSATPSPGATAPASPTATTTMTPAQSETPSATATLNLTEPATPTATLVSTRTDAPGGSLRTFLPLVTDE